MNTQTLAVIDSRIGVVEQVKNPNAEPSQPFGLDAFCRDAIRDVAAPIVRLTNQIKYLGQVVQRERAKRRDLSESLDKANAELFERRAAMRANVVRLEVSVTGLPLFHALADAASDLAMRNLAQANTIADYAERHDNQRATLYRQDTTIADLRRVLRSKDGEIEAVNTDHVATIGALDTSEQVRRAQREEIARLEKLLTDERAAHADTSAKLMQCAEIVENEARKEHERGAEVERLTRLAQRRANEIRAAKSARTKAANKAKRKK